MQEFEDWKRRAKLEMAKTCHVRDSHEVRFTLFTGSVCALIILLSHYDKVNLLYLNVTPKMANYISCYCGLNVVQHIKPTCIVELKEASSELP